MNTTTRLSPVDGETKSRFADVVLGGLNYPMYQNKIAADYYLLFVERV